MREPMDRDDAESPIAGALSKIPLPEPNEMFVRKVMAGVREAERKKNRWKDWWQIPSLGIGLASLAFYVLVAAQSSTEPSETTLLAGFEDSLPASTTSLTSDDVLQFALEEPGGSL